MLNGETNENNAKDYFGGYIEDDYNYILKKGKMKINTKADKLKNNMKKTKKIIFGPEEKVETQYTPLSRIKSPVARTMASQQKEVQRISTGREKSSSQSSLNRKKPKGGRGLKIMTPNQLLTRLPIY